MVIALFGFYSVSKTIHLTLNDLISSADVDRFSNFFHCQIPEEILYTNIAMILHLTLSVLLLYLVKLDNYNCCRFQRHIACETLEFILQHMRPPK